MTIKLNWGLFILSVGIGIYFLVIAIYFYSLYLLADDSPSRYELLMGAAVGSLFAAPSWCAASFGAWFLGNKLSSLIRVSTYTITILSSLVLMYFLAFD